MLQLIYTSAPRLLEAGKTGFGTVACSRRIPRPLVTYLERISTFDRAAGVSSLLFYSVFRMGKMVFHVFSRVADCGVDYTRRTNHIAHHWVMDDEAAAAPEMSASTPAGMLLSLRGLWLNTWQGNPAWLEEEPVVTPHVDSGSACWLRLTGQEDNALWLAANDFADGGYLCLPPCSDEDILHLLHEAMMRRSDHGWGLGFTTAAVETLSSKVSPLVCLSAAQQSAGIRVRNGYARLQVQQGMLPPSPADLPATSSDPGMSVAMQDSVQQDSAIPSYSAYPPSMSSAPMPAVAEYPLPQAELPPVYHPDMPQPVPNYAGKNASPDDVSFRGESSSSGNSSMVIALIGLGVVAVGAFFYFNQQKKDKIDQSPIDHELRVDKKEVKSESKPESKPEPMPEPMPESNPEPKPEPMLEPMTESNPEPKPEPMPEPMTESNPEPKPEAGTISMQHTDAENAKLADSNEIRIKASCDVEFDWKAEKIKVRCTPKVRMDDLTAAKAELKDMSLYIKDKYEMTAITKLEEASYEEGIPEHLLQKLEERKQAEDKEQICKDSLKGKRFPSLQEPKGKKGKSKSKKKITGEERFTSEQIKKLIDDEKDEKQKERLKKVQAEAVPFFELEEAESQVNKLKQEVENMKKEHEAALTKYYKERCDVIFKLGKAVGMMQELTYEIINRPDSMCPVKQQQDKK